MIANAFASILPLSQFLPRFSENALPLAEGRFIILSRTRLGLNRTTRANKIFHIFLHPWDLLLCKRVKRDLKNFLDSMAQKREGGKLEVLTMGDLSFRLGT